jgi:hypothetical protein
MTSVSSAMLGRLGSSILFVLLLLPAQARAQDTQIRTGVESRSEDARANRSPPASPAAEAELDSSLEIDEIEIDGHLDEADWASARVFTGFTQAEPVEGSVAEHDTEVRILFGEDAIWVAARMWDPEPTTIDRRLARRDAHTTTDQFSVHFDPNRDGLTGYSFGVSAANVQGDVYFYDDTRMDGAWNAVWSSAVIVDDEGWTAEFRIPLSQIRYEASDDIQSWGVNFHRFRVENNERSYFSLISKLRRGIVSQMGQMDNVRVARPSRRLEMLPYAVSSLENGPAEAGDPFFDGSAAGGRVGVDLSYGLGSSFTLDATFNPDFGQVEADPAVINLTAFETFQQEKRPFFVEDARVFDFNLGGHRDQLFYSRRVGRRPHGGAPSDTDFAETPSNATILGAAKLSGRTTGGLSIGALGAVTGSEYGRGLYETGALGEFLVEPQTSFGVLSLAQDLNEGRTQFRGITTAMRRDLPADASFDWLPSSAFNAGVRFEHQWADRMYAVNALFAGSHVRGSEAAMTRVQTASTHYLQRPDATRFSVDPNARSLSGRDWRVQLEKRGGEHWTGGIWAAEISNLFEVNELGFSTRAEKLDAGARFGYREILPGDVFRNYKFTLTTYHNWSHEALDDVWSLDSWGNGRTNGMYSLETDLTFLNYWHVKTNLRYSAQKMSRSATRGGPMMIGPASRAISADFNTDRRKPFSMSAHFERSDDEIGTGGKTQIRGGVTLRPSDNLSFSLTPKWETSTSGSQYVTATSTLPYDPTFGTRYLFADLDRESVSMVTRVDWTFTPTLSLQLYAQPLLSSGDYLQYKQLAESKSFDFNGFVPGTATEQPGGVLCTSSICEVDGTQHVDFDNDGATDYSFSDRDFNIRSLIGNAVVRWEYRPGSTIFFVWQRNQVGRSSTGSFDFNRDVGALFDAPSENRFIVKVNYWLGL